METSDTVESLCKVEDSCAVVGESLVLINCGVVEDVSSNGGMVVVILEPVMADAPVCFSFVTISQAVV